MAMAVCAYLCGGLAWAWSSCGLTGPKTMEFLTCAARRAQMGSGGMMGMGNGMIPMQVPGGQVPSMVPVGITQASHHMQGARLLNACAPC